MQKCVVIDCCTLGVLANPNGTQEGRECREWAENLRRKGTLVRISGIANYESRRKLIQIPNGLGIAELDEVIKIYGLLSVTDAVLRRAAQIWSDLKIGLGRGTDNLRLDADVIVAAEAIEFAQDEGVDVIVATDNVRHFQPLVEVQLLAGAMEWRRISP